MQRTADGAFDLGLDESKIYRFKYGKSIDVTMLRTVFDNSPGFTLGPRLGAGSFGTVYRGATPHSDAAGSAVAFKFPLMKDVEMILSEVAVVNRLQHVYHNRPAVLDLLALPRDVFWVVTGKKQRQDQIIFALDYMT